MCVLVCVFVCACVCVYGVCESPTKDHLTND